MIPIRYQLRVQVQDRSIIVPAILYINKLIDMDTSTDQFFDPQDFYNDDAPLGNAGSEDDYEPTNYTNTLSSVVQGFQGFSAQPGSEPIQQMQPVYSVPQSNVLPTHAPISANQGYGNIQQTQSQNQPPVFTNPIQQIPNQPPAFTNPIQQIPNPGMIQQNTYPPIQQNPNPGIIQQNTYGGGVNNPALNFIPPVQGYRPPTQFINPALLPQNNPPPSTGYVPPGSGYVPPPTTSYVPPPQAPLQQNSGTLTNIPVQEGSNIITASGVVIGTYYPSVIVDAAEALHLITNYGGVEKKPFLNNGKHSSTTDSQTGYNDSGTQIRIVHNQGYPGKTWNSDAVGITLHRLKYVVDGLTGTNSTECRIRYYPVSKDSKGSDKSKDEISMIYLGSEPIKVGLIHKDRISNPSNPSKKMDRILEQIGRVLQPGSMLRMNKSKFVLRLPKMNTSYAFIEFYNH